MGGWFSAGIKNFKTRPLLFLRAGLCSRSFRLLCRLFNHTRFLEVFVVIITEILVGIPIINERKDEPDEQHQGNHNGHDHVPDLITEVHEYGNDIVCFRQRQDANRTLEHQDQRMVRAFTFVDIIDQQTDTEFDDRDDGKQDGRFADPCLEISIGVLGVKSDLGGNNVL